MLVQRAAVVSLDWDTRQKSRFHAVDSQGRNLGIFLPSGTVVRGGDVLVAQTGFFIAVVAAPQPILRIEVCPEHGTPFNLLRAAYHLGNRHVPVELQQDHLKIEPDHVLSDLLEILHMRVRAETQPFEPEGGAYGVGALLGHSHAHEHIHEHHHP